MQVTVNGETSNLNDGCTVAELLSHLKIGRERVAVEICMQIVPKAKYDIHLISEGDSIEIVHFVGGG